MRWRVRSRLVAVGEGGSVAMDWPLRERVVSASEATRRMAMRSWPGGVKVFSRVVPESQRGAGGRLAIWAGRLVAARRVTRKMRLRGMGMKRRWAGESFSRDREKRLWSGGKGLWGEGEGL
jgi:hypothetical protein